MGVPVYGTDLTDVFLDTGGATTGWSAVAITGTGPNAVAVETDFFIQGVDCISRAAWSSGQKGMIYNSGAGITLPTDGAVLVWCNYLATNAIDTKSNGGLRVWGGSSASAFYLYNVDGSDTNVFGGWTLGAFDPACAAGPDATQSSPSSTLQYIGSGALLPGAGPSKGNPMATDAIRWGRCELRFISGSVGDGYATFTGANTYAGATTRRWGLLSLNFGAYRMSGLLVFGLSTRTTTLRQRTSNVATLTTSVAHNLATGATVTITGVGGTGYNATAAVASTPSATSFTYANTGSNEGSTSDTGGTVSAPVDFNDSNRIIFIRDHDRVTANFNGIEIRNAASVVTWTNISMTALGTVSPGRWLTTDNATITMDNCTFTDMGTFAFLTGLTAVDSTWRRCKAITAAGCSLNNCSVLASSVAADASALIWDVATDPDGYLDGMSYSKGATAHHAIEFGTSSPTVMTLRGLAFSGFNAADANNDSTLRFLRTSGTITVYLVGCTGNISIKKEGGATVTLVQDPVTIAVNVKNLAGDNLQDARVMIKASDGTGPFPFEDVVTISNSGTTATVTHAAHGMASSDKIVVKGASLAANNGIFTITVNTAGEYTYTMGSSPGSSPTGTILATFVALHALTDASGNVSGSRVYSSSQPITGWVRKGTSPTYYKQSIIGGEVDSSIGLSVSIKMIEDD